MLQVQSEGRLFKVINADTGKDYIKLGNPMMFASGKEAAEFVEDYNKDHVTKLRVVKAPAKPVEEIQSKIKSGELAPALIYSMFSLPKHPIHCAHHRDDITKLYFFPTVDHAEAGKLEEIPTLDYLDHFYDRGYFAWDANKLKTTFALMSKDLKFEVGYDPDIFIEAYTTKHLGSCVAVGGTGGTDFNRGFMRYITEVKHPMAYAACGDWAIVYVRDKSSKQMICRGLALPAKKIYFNLYGDQTNDPHAQQKTGLHLKLERELGFKLEVKPAPYAGTKQLVGPQLKGYLGAANFGSGEKRHGNTIYFATAPLQPVARLLMSSDEKHFINDGYGDWANYYSHAYAYKAWTTK